MGAEHAGGEGGWVGTGHAGGEGGVGRQAVWERKKGVVMRGGSGMHWGGGGRAVAVGVELWVR